MQDNDFLKMLIEVNKCAEFLVTTTSCNKANAWKALLKISSCLNDVDLKPLIDIIPNWIGEPNKPICWCELMKEGKQN